MSCEDLSNSVIFPRGEEQNVFNKKAYMHMLVDFDDPINCPIGNVTFSPGCHNDWHIHYGAQVLLVTGGEGYYQEWGQKAMRIRAGDVVTVQAGVKHWHGATPDHWFVHIGMIIQEERPTLGLETLTEEAYLSCEI